MEKSLNNMVLPAITLAIGMIVSTSIAACSALKFKNMDQTVFVTGAARKRITSDLGVWSVTVSREAPKIHDAYTLLAGDIPKVETYIRKKGFSQDQMTRSSISTTTLKEQKHGTEGESGGKIIGYNLSQCIQVRSNDVQKLAAVAREATELLEQGILIESGSPQFYCSSIGELKQAMLADAAKDAQLRAKKIAENTGSRIGPLRSAKMGALQITAPNSTEVSDSGISDSTSIEKDITAVVNVSFAVE
jgi:uncharacterized protein